ncbi:MAG: alginate export family protein [Planctomycetota bacterium]|nr:alginate export family protein [Planctomycetota bacterium]
MAGKHGRWLVVSVVMCLAWSVAVGEQADGSPAGVNDLTPPTFTAPEMSLAAAPAPVAAAAVKPAEPATSTPGCPFCDMKKGITQAVPWLQVGGDFRFRENYGQNLKTLQNRQTWHFERYRGRLWWKVSPCDDVSFNFRLTYEPYIYDHPTTQLSPANNEALFDEMNFEWKKFLGLPVTLKVGRQDITLGDKWLVYDGTPGDGSRTAFFDAVRATITCDPQTKSSLDLIYTNNRANSSALIRPFNDQGVELAETDSQGVIVYGSNKSIQDTTLEPYFIYKHDEWIGKAQEADIYTFGLRAVRNFGEHWVASGELAKQFGQKQGRELDSLGFNGRATYKVKDPHETEVYAGYEFDSGDKPGTSGRDEGFDRLWGRGVVWSDLHNGYVDSIEGPKTMSTNMHRISMGWQASFEDPCGCKFSNVAKPYTLVLEHNILFADENYAYVKGISPSSGKTGFSKDGNFRGQLPRAQLSYKFNEHISGHFQAEFFFPGDYYTDLRNDVALFLRYQLVVTW